MGIISLEELRAKRERNIIPLDQLQPTTLEERNVRAGGIGRKIFGEVKTPEQVETEIEQRPDILGETIKEAPRDIGKSLALSPFLPAGLSTGIKAIGGLFERGVSAVTGPILRVQTERNKGNVPETFNEALEEGKLAFGDFVKGITGERTVQTGDLFRVEGIPENLSATLGLATEIAIANLASGGRGAVIAKKGIDLAKPKVITAATNFADDVVTKLPGKPRIFGTKWLDGFVKQGRDITDDLQRSLGNAFDDVITPQMKNTKVTGLDKPLFELLAGQPEFIGTAEKQLLRNMDDFFLARFGDARVNTVEKVRLLKSLLRSNIPKTLYTGGGTIGKATSIKLKQKGLINTLTNLEQQSLRNAGLVKEAEQLAKLNNFAHTQVYPKLDNMRILFGKSGTPTLPSGARIEKTLSLTGGLRGLTGQGGGPLARLSEREAIKGVTRLSRLLKKFITTGQYGDDLLDVIRSSKSLTKQIVQFRRRGFQKAGAVGAALFFGGRKLFGRDGGREE